MLTDYLVLACPRLNFVRRGRVLAGSLTLGPATRVSGYAVPSSPLTQKLSERKLFYVIWLINGKPVGRCNIDKIVFGEEAYMHLHMWDTSLQKLGFGLEFLKMALPYFFENSRLKNLFCEPNARNEAPNKSLEKLGFEFLKTYETVPEVYNFRQLAPSWATTNERFFRLSNN